MTMVIDGSNGLTFPAGSTQTQSGISQSFVNRIINGNMVIDQRNAGASVTGNNWPVDRFVVKVSQSSKLTAQQNAGAVTPPTGFTNYVGVTSSSSYSSLAGDYFILGQPIEGNNVADLAWGTTNAQAITLSFWVRISITGLFGGCLRNSANNRVYPFSYTINSANTWEYKTVTIAGDTTGTWLTNNGIGIELYFDLGCGTSNRATAGTWTTSNVLGATGSNSVVGTNGATFYITGVDLRVGSYTVVPQEFRAYGTELTLCQRYYENSYPTGVAVGTGGYYANGFGIAIGASDLWGSTTFKIPKRATPTIAIYGSGTGTANKARQSVSATEVTTTGVGQITTLAFTDVSSASLFNTTAPNNMYDFMWTASAEL